MVVVVVVVVVVVGDMCVVGVAMFVVDYVGVVIVDVDVVCVCT